MSEQPAAKPNTLSLSIKDTEVLYTAYMSFVNSGGIFIPTSRDYTLGDEVHLLISLMDEKEKFEVNGKVVWITPKGSTKAAGIGVQFQGENAKVVQTKMENYLAAKLNSDKPTHTF